MADDLERRMPTVATDGKFKFVVYSREKDFEPPHVHVKVGNQDLCRIELNGGRFMDNPSPGEARAIKRSYSRHAETIRKAWDDTHRR